MEDKCVMCGDSVPEGRMVCYNCEYPAEPNFDTAKITVSLNKIRDIYRFTQLSSKCKEDVVVKTGRYSVNAKSLLGLMSLDLSKPLKVEFYGSIPYEVREGMKKFIMD